MDYADAPKLPDRIETPADVVQFFAYLMLVDQLSFHPDTSFFKDGKVQYVKGGVPMYTPAQAKNLDRLMKQAWSVDLPLTDIYAVGLATGAWFGYYPKDNLDTAPEWLIDILSRGFPRKQDWSSRPSMGAAKESPEASYRIPFTARAEFPDAERRAHEAGAPEDLEIIGVGMYGIVFCDQRGHAWKVGRLEKPDSDRTWIREALGEEAEWLHDASASPIAKHVAKVYAYHAGPVVLERECVSGAPGGWNDGTKLRKLHNEIEDAMIPLGWTAPEFKEDSYIFRKDGTAVLVDASMGHRVGENLARYVEDVLESRRKTRERWHDLAFYLLREMREKTVPRARGLALLERLSELDPEIRKFFSW